MSNETKLTPEQLAEERRRDVMAYAYRDKAGKLFTIDEDGDLVAAPAGAKTLTPEYQKMADQVAGLAMTYRKVLALNEADRGVLASLIDGTRKTTSGISDEVSNIWGSLAGDISIPGSGALDAAGNVINGAKVPFEFIGNILKAGKGVFDQIGGGEMNKENALAIGTAYASARQAAALDHPKSEGLGDFFSGLFSKNFGNFASAGFFWILDAATGLLEKLPVIGEWIKKQGWHSGKSFGEHLESRMRDDDNQRVEKEMTKLDEIGGVNSEDLSIFTRGGTVQNSDGTETSITAPDADKSAPENADGTTPQTPEQAAAANKNKPKHGFTERSIDAVREAVSFDNSKEAMENPGVGTAVGIAATAKGTQGFAEGFTRQMVGEKSGPAKAAEKLAKQSEKLMEKATAAKEGSKGKVLLGQQTSLGAKAPNEKAAAELTEKALEKEAKAVEKAAKATARNAVVNEKVLSFADDAAKPITGFWSRAFNSTRLIGRKLGDCAGYLTNGAIRIGEAAASILPASVTGPVSSLATKCTPMLGAASKLLGRASPYIAPAISAVTLTKGYMDGDDREVRKSGVELATIGGCAATGAALGLCGGPFAPLTVPAGAVIGTIVGGVASLFTGYAAAKHYDKHHPPKAAEAVANPTPTLAKHSVEADPAIAAVYNEQFFARQMKAQAAAKDVKLNNTSMGSVNSSAVAGIGTKTKTLHIS